MGGYGSGRWTRPDKKADCEVANKIDIRILNRHGALAPGTSGTISWESDGNQTDFINFSINEQCLMLDACNIGTIQTIHFDWTECNYGGKRTWVLCPVCHARVSVLYSGNKGFACRQCNDLKYACQSESDLDRLYRKICKLRKRLGGSDNLSKPLWLKPKGMHRRTFARLLDIEKKLKQQLQVEMLAGFDV